MEPLVVAFLAVMLFGIYLAFSRRRRVLSIPEQSITIDRVPEKCDEFLSAGPSNGSFLQFALSNGTQSDDMPFLQISVEDSRIGIDHILLSKANRDVESKFRDAVRKHRLTEERRIMNEVEYLRVLTDHPSPVVVRILQDAFGVSPTAFVCVGGVIRK